MPITIKLGDAADKTVTLEMDVRKGLNGDLMIFDHSDIDIVISSAQNKIVAFPKETMSDYVYGAQNRLFAFLRKRGIVIPESIHGGSFGGALAADLLTPINVEQDAGKVALVNISLFIEDERPYFESTEAITAMANDDKIDPERETSTELGEVPHSTRQGSIRRKTGRASYSPLGNIHTL